MNLLNLVEDIELIINHGVDPITGDLIQDKAIAKTIGYDKAKLEVIKCLLIYVKRHTKEEK